MALPTPTRVAVLEQLALDCRFLARHQIVDYSLLIAICKPNPIDPYSDPSTPSSDPSLTATPTTSSRRVGSAAITSSTSGSSASTTAFPSSSSSSPALSLQSSISSSHNHHNSSAKAPQALLPPAALAPAAPAAPSSLKISHLSSAGSSRNLQRRRSTLNKPGIDELLKVWYLYIYITLLFLLSSLKYWVYIYVFYPSF